MLSYNRKPSPIPPSRCQLTISAPRRIDLPRIARWLKKKTHCRRTRWFDWRPARRLRRFAALPRNYCRLSTSNCGGLRIARGLDSGQDIRCKRQHSFMKRICASANHAALLMRHTSCAPPRSPCDTPSSITRNRVWRKSRGGGDQHLTLSHVADLSIDSDEGMLALNEAMERMAKEMPRLADVVECRFFGGYGEEDTARALGMSLRTVQRDWLKARAWLFRELGGTIG